MLDCRPPPGTIDGDLLPKTEWIDRLRKPGEGYISPLDREVLFETVTPDALVVNPYSPNRPTALYSEATISATLADPTFPERISNEKRWREARKNWQPVVAPADPPVTSGL